MRLFSTGDVVYYIYKYINMNIVICGVTNSPASLPICGPCEVVPRFLRPVRMRDLWTLPRPPSLTVVSFCLPLMGSGRWHLCILGVSLTLPSKVWLIAWLIV